MSLLLFSLQDITGPLQLSQGVATVKMPGKGTQGGCREEEMSGLSRWSRLGGGWQVRCWEHTQERNGQGLPRGVVGRVELWPA